MITIYRANEENFATLGMGALNPIDVAVTWEKGGRYDLTLKQPITDDGKWMMIAEDCIIRAPSPVRESPYVELTASGTSTSQTIIREIYKVKTPSGGRLRLRKSASTSSKILSSHKPGTEVVRTETAGDWSKVIVVDGGAVGWMYSDYLTYVRTETETVSKGDKPGAIVKRRQAGDQLYRITDYDTDSANGVIVVNAEHISYDLGWVKVIGKCDIKDMPIADALRKVQSMESREHDFEIHCLVEGNVSGDYTNKSLLECIRDPKIGFATQLKARVICDNFDVWILPEEVRDMGVVLRYRKNLLGVKMKVDTSNRVTRIYPVGEDADGELLYLDGKGYVESENAANLIGKDAVKKYSVKVGDNDGEFATVKEARAELERLAMQDMQAGADGKMVSLDVNFLDLGETEEYSQYKGLLIVHPYDTVTIVRGEFGIREKAELSKCTMDGLTKKYRSTTFGALQSETSVVYSFDIAAGAVGSAQIAQGAVGAAAIRNLSIQYAKIAIATIKQLNAEAVNAITGRFNEIAAGSITTDELYAAIAKIITLRVKQINAENITTDELYAALADVILLRAQQITADNIETDELAAAYAEITTLLVENINAGNVQADKLGAALANFVTMYAGTGEFDFATIQNLVAKALSLEQASAESVYIKNLAVTSANLLSATLGKLVLKGDDGRYYRVFVGSDGSISTEEIVPTDDEIQNGQTSGGQRIVETSMNVGSLNASNLQASSAVINQILTTALTAEKITAADALIASASIPALYTTSIKALGAGLDLSANEYIQLIVGEVDSKIAAKSNVFRGETAPDDANVNDLWIVPSTGYTYQLAADDGSHPSYYLDENGVLYYSYGANQKEYALYMDDSGDLYISADTDFVAAITQDGTPALWQRVKDSELEDAAKAASDAAEAAQIAAQAAQDKANQNAEDMAQTVTRFEGELSSLQSQIDGSITTWFEYGAPTYYNYPASQWTTADMRNAHLGDLYYDRYTGYCYRWQLSGSAYEWTRISDTDVTKALNDAAAAKDVADSKRRVFVSTPTPPYDIGDLWVQGANGDILRCQKPRAAGGYYYASDWVPASKYTDDTKANENAQIIAQHTAELQLMDSRITARVEQSISEVSGELETQISSSFSEVTQTVDELRVVMEQNRAADKSELRTYLRYADGTLELGRSGSRYVARTSDNGFVVLQDGAEMAAMVQNTVSAPVVEARRQFVLGEYAIRIGADGGILFV